MEATTLTDALLDDLDDLSDVDEEEEKNEESSPEEADGMDVDDNRKQPSTNAADEWWPVGEGKQLLHDNVFQKHMVIIESIISKTEKSMSSMIEENHQLLVRSNRFLVAANDDLAIAHKVLCQAYEPKFPELEELVPNATQYVKAVRILGNSTDMTSKSISDGLHQFLTNHQIITLTVAESTSGGRKLTDEELDRVNTIAAYMERVVAAQSTLISFIELHMVGLAPSVCAIIGPRVAAQLLALTGSLAALAQIPSSNLQVVGQVKQGRTAVGGTAQRGPHQGVLVEADIVQRCSKSLQQKALKLVSSKLALAIRCDFVNFESGRPRSAEAGIAFRSQIEDKLNKLAEPDKAPVLKALPKPDLTVKRRRGGKRMRRLKERFEETSLMKQANTRAFSEQAGEYGDDAMGRTLGLLDTTTASGSVRKTSEKRKVKFANTRASRKKAAQAARSASANTSGLASSVVFTPVQGMELVNPDAQKDRIRQANEKWFSENAGFQSALPKK